jgi:dTDP-4-amino-4,6-dideoxygalactose transaminase
VFSLSGTKLVTGGAGELATFRDPEAAESFSYLRAYGFEADYNRRHVGLIGKLSELNAALTWLSPERLDDANTRPHWATVRATLRIGLTEGGNRVISLTDSMIAVCPAIERYL